MLVRFLAKGGRVAMCRSKLTHQSSQIDDPEVDIGRSASKGCPAFAHRREPRACHEENPAEAGAKGEIMPRGRGGYSGRIGRTHSMHQRSACSSRSSHSSTFSIKLASTRCLLRGLRGFSESPPAAGGNKLHGGQLRDHKAPRVGASIPADCPNGKVEPAESRIAHSGSVTVSNLHSVHQEQNQSMRRKFDPFRQNL